MVRQGSRGSETGELGGGTEARAWGRTSEARGGSEARGSEARDWSRGSGARGTEARERVHSAGKPTLPGSPV